MPYTPSWATDANLYHTLEVQLHHPPSIPEYNEGVRWVNVAYGSHIAEARSTTGAVPPRPVPTGPVPGAVGGTTGGGTGGLVVTGPGGAGTSEVYNADLVGHQYDIQLQSMSDAAAMARTQASVSASLASAQASAQAQIEAQRLADAAALERLRYQLGNDLASALMQNDENMFHRTLDAAGLAADPRSTVGFLEYLAQQGGGPTAQSQNLAAGMTPSPVWDYLPQTQGLSPEIQALITTLQGFISGGTSAPAGAAGGTPVPAGAGYAGVPGQLPKVPYSAATTRRTTW